MEQDLTLLKQVLSLTFQKNMHFLKAQQPNLYQEFVDYRPQQYGLEIDSDGNLNIAGNGHFIYDRNPKDVSEQQLKEYFEEPKGFVYRLTDYDSDTGFGFAMHPYIHTGYIDAQNRIAKKYWKNNGGFEPVDKYPLLCVMGIGLGYHLEKLANSNVEVMAIYEPNRDFFYASLHTVDYEWLFRTFAESNRGLSMLVGKTVEEFSRVIHIMGERAGFYRFAFMPIFKHYQNDSVNDFSQELGKHITLFYSGFGFCEDEVISLRNTVINARDKMNVLNQQSTAEGIGQLKNVFICGSGPSIDSSFEYIKDNRNNALVISCGSSLKALYTNDIVPDFHIEMERTEHLVDWLEKMEPEFVSQITLVGPNILSNKVVSKFKQAIHYLKINDTGTEVIKKLARNEKLVELSGCSPTVTNAALAVSSYLNAQNVYLFGVDLGFKDAEYHHSKSTGYFDKDEKKFKMKGAFTREGAHGGLVSTTEVFDWARHMLEYVIIRNTNMKVINCSDGIKIEGAEAKLVSELPDLEIFDHKSYVKSLFSSSVYNSYSSSRLNKLVAEQIRTFRSVIEEVSLPEKLKAACESEESLIDYFYESHLKFFTVDDDGGLATQKFLGGSFRSMHTNMLSCMFRIHSKAERLEYIKESISLLELYFKEMLHLLESQIRIK